jgi:hypothetical protein
MQTFVHTEIKVASVDGQRADVVHDFTPEIVFATFWNFDFLFDTAHQSLVGRFGLSGVFIPYFFFLSVGFNVIDVILTEFPNSFFVGTDGALNFIFDDLFVLFTDDG